MRALVHVLATTTEPFRLCPAGEAWHQPVVAVSGTRTLRDVLDDLDVRRCSLELHGRVHCGMHDRTKRFYADVAAFCAAAPEPPLVAGWSLGGGVSVLLAAMLARDGIRVAGVHTYGAPRVGDAAFARWYARLGHPTVRYETPKDPVVRLPGKPYVPVGRLVRVPCTNASWWAHHDLRAYARGLEGR